MRASVSPRFTESPSRCRISTTLPDTTLFTSTLTSGCTLPTSVTFTWTSATSALPTFTGSFASGFLPVAFIATNVMTIATARTMIDHTASFFLRFPLIELSSIRYCERKRPRRGKVSGCDRRCPPRSPRPMKRPASLLFAAALLCVPLAADQSLFRNAMIGYGGGSVIDMKTADVNHDGKADVILVQEFGATGVSALITLLGNGDGTYRPPVKTPIATPGLIAVADLDGDGQIDLVLNRQYSVLETYRGNSDGSFTLRSTQNAANIITGTAMILTDLNGDGKLDLIGAMGVSGNFQTPLVTFLGKGDGTFAPGITQPGPYTESMNDIAIGDFNGDGRTDVIESSFRDQRIATGKGDGSFNAPVTITSETSRAVVAGDFNGDGKLDYISTGLPTSLHLGNGNGTFTNGVTYNIGETVRPVAVDFDGDGKLDLVAPGNDLVAVMHGNGDGTFTAQSYVATSTFLLVADFDGDHHPDVLAASFPGLILLHGNGDGTLRAYRKSFLGSGSAGGQLQFDFIGIAAADFNGDGKPDVVSRYGGIVLMLNTGDSGFGPPRLVAPSDDVNKPLVFATGDVNGDGRADIVVAGSKLQAYLGNGDGTFTPAAPVVIPTYFRLLLADMNGDGKLDAVLTRWDINGQLLLGNGDGTFGAPTQLPGRPAQIADFNGDGRADFASNEVSNGYTMYRNNGNATFTAGTTVPNTVGALAVGDFNGDGKIDLVEEQYSSYIRMRLGKGDGTFTDLPLFNVAQLPGGAFADEAVTADFDGDGKLDLAFSNQVMLGNGDGTFRAIVPCVVSRTWSDLAATDVDGNGSADLLLLDPQNWAVNVLLTRTAAGGTTPLSLALTSSRSSVHFQEPFSVATAATTASSSILWGGVTIKVDGAFYGFAPWSDYSALLTVVHRALGEHEVTAEFIGDDVFSAARVSLVQSVLKLDSSIGIAASPNTSQQGQPTRISTGITARQQNAGPIPP